jgi:hypothetical protein
MKKIKKFMCSIVFAFTLVVSSVLGPSTAQAAILYDDSDAEVTTLSTVLAATGSKEDLEKNATYTIQTTSADELVPIDIPAKGYMDFYVITNVNSEIGIYVDESCTTKTSSTVYISSYSDQVQEGVYGEDGYAYFPKAGTYYVKFKTPGTYVFTSQMVDGGNQTLKDNTYTTAYGYNYDTYNYDSRDIYFKFTASKTGYATVDTEFLSDYGNAYITLCNSSKKAISEDVYSSNNYVGKSVFAVKKGTTYYFKVKTSSGKYRIKSKVTGVTESSGAKKSQAKTLTIGKVRKGIVLSEDKTSKSDWYKFTLSKATKLDLTVAGNASSGRVRIELTSANIGGSVNVSINSVGYKTSTSLQTYTSSTLPKGTYYIRVYKEDKKVSGNYSIKVSKR